MPARETDPRGSLPEKYLGRRLRPWWGQRPGSLAFRGLVQGVLLGALAIWMLRIAGEGVDTTDLDVSVSDGQIRLIATIIAVLCGIGALLGLVRLVVGGIDVFSRRTVEGTVLSSRERHPGDWMPGWARTALRLRRRHRRNRSHQNDHPGRSRYEIVLDTGSGPQSWNVERSRFDPYLAGRRARITVTPLIGHVRKIEALDPAPPRAAAPSGFAGSAPGVGGPLPHDAPPPGWDDPEHDVLKQVPGYENHGRQDPLQAGLDRFRAIPGLGGLVDKVPNLDEAMQKAQEQIRKQSEKDGETPPEPRDF